MGIKVNNVSYTYQKKASTATLALNDVSLEIYDNDFVALVGETGSGKSTLVQCFNGLIIPDNGEIVVDDFIVSYKNRKSRRLKNLRKRVGLVFQFPEYQLFEETVEKDVAFGVKNFGLKGEAALEKAHQALDLVGLDSSYYQRPPFELSGGEKRKVAIAGVLVIEPDILVFDEPTAGLDPESSKELMALITKLHEQGKTIIVVTHDMDLVNTYAKRVLMLDHGKLVFSGTPNALFNHIQNYDRLDVPLLIKVAKKLKEKGMDLPVEGIHTIDDLLTYIKKWRENHV
ncbi:MAG: energy-coupling factor transporter ATPase [Erysipelotrichaceae bacterium]|mgnify:CR=1 FL=1|nr:energy-coupling factor transporter ATPase [Erysipelotrichaceae bacterium]